MKEADISQKKNNTQHTDNDNVSSPTSFNHDKLGSILLRFLNRLKKTGKSTHTIAAYRNDLSLFSEYLVEHQIDPQVASSNTHDLWLEYLKLNGRNSAASLRRAQMSSRTFLHFLISEKIITSSTLLETKSPRQPKHYLLTVLPEHYIKIVDHLRTQALGGDAKAIRDWSLLLLLGEIGLKASEAAHLKWGDIVFSESVVEETRGGYIRIPGNNERLIHFEEQIYTALTLLKNIRTQLDLDNSHESHLFFGFRNVSRQTRTGSLHRHGIKFIIYEVCNEILGIPYNAESMRNHAIVKWIEQGLQPDEVANLAGYSSLNSLDRFSVRELRKPKRRLLPSGTRAIPKKRTNI